MQPETKLASSAFPGKPKAAKKPAVFANLDDLEFCNDPPPQGLTRKVSHKYDGHFQKMDETGQPIKCPDAEIDRVSNALRKFINRHQLKDKIVRTRKGYDDSDKPGRVWLIDVSPKAKK